MKYKLAIFDLDGTLLETLEDLYISVNHALSENGLPLRTKKEIREFVGNGLRNLMIRSTPDGSDTDTVDKVHESFKLHYAVHSADNTAPYDGVISLLQKLKSDGVKIAVVSNKDDEAVKALCKKFFGDLIDLALGNRPDIKRKPAPDPVFYAIDHFGAKKEDAIYIGDSEVDIQTANNANLPCITVTWGFRDKDVLLESGAKIFANTMDELEKLL